MMNVRIYPTIASFLEVHKDTLLRKADQYQLILSNAMMYQERGYQEENIFGDVIHQGEVQAIFLNALPFNLQVATLVENKQAIEAIAQTITDKNIPITGINSDYDTAIVFMEQYKSLKNISYYQSLAMDIMRLESVHNISILNHLSFEVATIKDVEEVFLDMLAFYRFCFPHQKSFDEKRIYDKLLERIKQKTQFLIRDEQGVIASICQYSERPLFGGVSLSGVFTKDSHRKKGYATTLLYLVCKNALTSGYSFVSLFVDKTNPISNYVYLKLGFKYVASNYDFRIALEE